MPRQVLAFTVICLIFHSICPGKLNLTRSPFSESMTGTITFKFSINGKVQPDPVIIGVMKRTHEISSMVSKLCHNISKGKDSGEPSYLNSPVHFIKKNKYFETGMLLKNNGGQRAADGTSADSFVYRKKGKKIYAEKIRTKHEGYIASMVLDPEEFDEGLESGYFPVNSRISFSKDAGEDLDQKNIVFGFILGGAQVIDKILSQKLLQGSASGSIRIVSCSDPQLESVENDF